MTLNSIKYALPIVGSSKFFSCDGLVNSEHKQNENLGR